TPSRHFRHCQSLLRTPCSSHPIANQPPDDGVAAIGYFRFVSGADPQVRASAGDQLKLWSTYPVVREFLNDIRIHRLGIGDIQIALRSQAVALLGKAPTVQRRRQSRIDLESGVKIGNRIFRQSALQVDEAAAVEGVDEVGAQPKRLVAIL